MSEKKEILICSRCNTAVSIPLLVDEDVQDIGPMIWDDSVIIDTGHAWRIENSNNLHKKKQQETWFSHTSLVDSVVYDDSSIGCCGYYGRKNTRCSCGNIIGGRYDECAHMNRFEPNIKNTYWLVQSV